MEIRVYKSFELRSKGKTLFCSRIDCPDAFSFEKSIDVFHSIYGSDIIIEFLVV